jgi:hypothetical protein
MIIIKVIYYETITISTSIKQPIYIKITVSFIITLWDNKTMKQF